MLEISWHNVLFHMKEVGRVVHSECLQPFVKHGIYERLGLHFMGIFFKLMELGLRDRTTDIL